MLFLIVYILLYFLCCIHPYCTHIYVCVWVCRWIKLFAFLKVFFKIYLFFLLILFVTNGIAERTWNINTSRYYVRGFIEFSFKRELFLLRRRLVAIKNKILFFPTSRIGRWTVFLNLWHRLTSLGLQKNKTNARLTSVPEYIYFLFSTYSKRISDHFFKKRANRYGFLPACWVWLPALGASVFFVQHENQTHTHTYVHTYMYIVHSVVHRHRGYSSPRRYRYSLLGVVILPPRDWRVVYGIQKSITVRPKGSRGRVQLTVSIW